MFPGYKQQKRASRELEQNTNNNKKKGCIGGLSKNSPILLDPSLEKMLRKAVY